jgi:cytochrome c peroxidase
MNQHTSNDETKVSLGRALFNEPALSKDGTQSCASCHAASHAFIDPRHNASSADAHSAGAVSLGQDQKSLGDINTPSATYAAFIPPFYFDSAEGIFKGGLFLNGRANTLAEQAQQPFLNPLEMQNTKEGVVKAVQKKYSASLKALYGDDIFNNTETAYQAIADSIAAFEKTKEFASFDSKFDKVLHGISTFTEQEKRGLELFKDEKKGNCAACHPVPEKNSTPAESLFTDFSYDNLGTPKNQHARTQNGKPNDFVDEGLFTNPEAKDPALRGAFRVTSLRNIAVTAPYMHNGVFKELKTVVHFYNSRDVKSALNPETGQPWEPAEIEETKNTEELGKLGLTDQEVNDIVVFLKTLTDERYEHLMK